MDKASNFGSGHDLVVREFKPQMWIYADSSVPGACFRSCVSLSLCPSPALSLSLKNKPALKENKQKIKTSELKYKLQVYKLIKNCHHVRDNSEITLCAACLIEVAIFELKKAVYSLQLNF